MTELAQSLGFNLTDAFACDMELFAHFFQRAAAAIIQTKAQLENLALALGQTIEHILHLLLEQLMTGGIGRRKRSVILNEVTQVPLIFLPTRRLQPHPLLADLDDLSHLL